MTRSHIASHQHRVTQIRIAGRAGAVIASAVAVAVTATGPAAGATGPRSAGMGDWAQFGFSASHGGFNPFEHVLSPANVSKLTRRWSLPLNAGSDTSSPVVADGVVYAGSDGGVLYARQATTGLLLWSFSGALGDHIVSAPAVVNGVVYVSGNSHMYALAAATGQELWSFGTPFREESAPTVVNGAVYFSSANGNVDALAAASGHKLWSFTATGQHTSVAGSPAVANGLVYIGADINFTQTGATFYALLATTGKKVWTFARCCGFTSSAAVANGVVYLGENSSLLALDAATGRELLILAFSSSVADVEPAVANGMLAFETGFKGQLYAFGLTS